jgi:hypothetical protein
MTPMGCRYVCSKKLNKQINHRVSVRVGLVKISETPQLVVIRPHCGAHNVQLRAVLRFDRSIEVVLEVRSNASIVCCAVAFNYQLVVVHIICDRD